MHMNDERHDDDDDHQCAGSEYVTSRQCFMSWLYYVLSVHVWMWTLMQRTHIPNTSTYQMVDAKCDWFVGTVIAEKMYCIFSGLPSAGIGKKWSAPTVHYLFFVLWGFDMSNVDLINVQMAGTKYWIYANVVNMKPHEGWRPYIQRN